MIYWHRYAVCVFSNAVLYFVYFIILFWSCYTVPPLVSTTFILTLHHLTYYLFVSFPLTSTLLFVYTTYLFHRILQCLVILLTCIIWHFCIDAESYCRNQLIILVEIWSSKIACSLCLYFWLFTLSSNTDIPNLIAILLQSRIDPFVFYVSILEDRGMIHLI